MANTNDVADLIERLVYQVQQAAADYDMGKLTLGDMNRKMRSVIHDQVTTFIDDHMIEIEEVDEDDDDYDDYDYDNIDPDDHL